MYLRRRETRRRSVIRAGRFSPPPLPFPRRQINSTSRIFEVRVRKKKKKKQNNDIIARMQVAPSVTVDPDRKALSGRFSPSRQYEPFMPISTSSLHSRARFSLPGPIVSRIQPRARARAIARALLRHVRCRTINARKRATIRLYNRGHVNLCRIVRAHAHARARQFAPNNNYNCKIR